MTPEPISKNDLYIYDLPDRIFASVELVQFERSVEETELSNEISNNKRNDDDKPNDSHNDKSEDDFLKYNRKRVSRGLRELTEEEFDKLLEESSIESISGSESEQSEEEEDLEPSLYKRVEETVISGPNSEDSHSRAYLNTKTPFIYLKSPLLPEDKHFGIYKSFFCNSELVDDPLRAIDNCRQSQGNGKSALFMIGGGHFAGAIVSHKRRNIGGDAINHKISVQEQQVEIIKSKTFHRYTTRRKQGGSQGANDNSKGNAKSVGSNIRRYNEQALISEVRDLLKSWENELNQCQSVFIRANGATGRKTLVGYEGAVLKNGDERIKSFPFTTKRATTSELKRAWTKLAYISIESSIKEDEKKKQKLLQQQENLRRSQQQQQHQQQKPPLTEDDKHTLELIGFLKRSKAPLLVNYLKKHKLDANFKLTPSENYPQTPTLLHYAAAHGLSHMIQVLLVNLKANPTITNKAGRVASELSLNTATKRSFQISRFKLGEDYCDWVTARVGEGKSKEAFDEEDKHEQEKIKSEKQQQLQQELANKTEMEMKKPSFSNKGTVGGGSSLISDTSGLSEAQKMRLMREQRARAAESRMKR